MCSSVTGCWLDFSCAGLSSLTALAFLGTPILNATDMDSEDSELIFTISSIQHGRFEEVSSPGVSITQFTQAQIKNNDIQFVHDGSDIAPSYDVKVSDDSLESEIESA